MKPLTLSELPHPLPDGAILEFVDDEGAVFLTVDMNDPVTKAESLCCQVGDSPPFWVDLPSIEGIRPEELISLGFALNNHPHHISSISGRRRITDDIEDLRRSSRERINSVAPGLKNGHFDESGNFYPDLRSDTRIRVRDSLSPYDSLRKCTELCLIEDISVFHYPGVTLPPSKTAYSVGKWLSDELKKDRWENRETIEVLELCTGSGVISTSLLKNGPSNLEVVATDVDGECLVVSELTSKASGIDPKKIGFMKGDLYDAVQPQRNFDIIVANPPFYDSSGAERVVDDPKFRESVPMLAIDGGEDGLDFYRRILKEGKLRLNPGGLFVLQVSPKISQQVRALSHECLGFVRGSSVISEGNRTDYKGFIVVIEP